MTPTPAFPFEIHPSPEGWRWAVRTHETACAGAAPSRAAAAACVILVLAQSAADRRPA